MTLETEEESGSPNLIYLFDKLADKIKIPDVLFCLDTGCLTRDRMWTISSLKGLVSCTLRVESLITGAHSGSAGGIVPETYRVATKLINRLEDLETYECSE